MTIGATNSTHHLPPKSKPSETSKGANAFLALRAEKDPKKMNPLSNANLPGGIFTYPGC